MFTLAIFPLRSLRRSWYIYFFTIASFSHRHPTLSDKPARALSYKRKMFLSAPKHGSFYKIEKNSLSPGAVFISQCCTWTFSPNQIFTFQYLTRHREPPIKRELLSGSFLFQFLSCRHLRIQDAHWRAPRVSSPRSLDRLIIVSLGSKWRGQ